ncbi:MAG: iron-sulfur cluster assembly scaffold protein [Proteobacteria bacterium]|nr:iron-sulfur cluster assembly scaffold protein [Pseudomonadota bacterium]
MPNTFNFNLLLLRRVENHTALFCYTKFCNYKIGFRNKITIYYKFQETACKILKLKVFRHLHNPYNKGRLQQADETHNGTNPFCGDDIVIDIKLDNKGNVIDVAWEGEGCAISKASASIFSEMIINKNLDKIKKINNNNFLKKLDIELSPTRIKCALLPLYTLKGIDLEEI